MMILNIDVLKALCLGARAVGLGRPFMYGQSAYGAAGVVKTVRILEREIVTGMRLLGATSVAELLPEMVSHKLLYLKLTLICEVDCMRRIAMLRSSAWTGSRLRPNSNRLSQAISDISRPERKCRMDGWMSAWNRRMEKCFYGRYVSNVCCVNV